MICTVCKSSEKRETIEILLIVGSYVVCIYIYAAIVWSHYKQSDSHQLEMRAARYVMNCYDCHQNFSDMLCMET